MERKNCLGCSNFIPEKPWCKIPNKANEWAKCHDEKRSEPSMSWRTSSSICGDYNTVD